MTSTVKETNRKETLLYAVWFLIYTSSFFVLDLQGVPTGDDLGYLFTDSSHHLGDGSRVSTLSDLTATQASHYINCNGRFLTHWLTMFFLNIGGHQLFCALSAVIFFFTVILFARLSGVSSLTRAKLFPVFAFLIWFCVPQPGLNWLSLVSYSTNYLWAACANLWMLDRLESIAERLAAREPRISVPPYPVSQRILAALAFIIVGSLQESFSVPISCGLFIWTIINRKRINRYLFVPILCYWLGTCVCFFAPGNFHHAAMGGGFASAAIEHKVSAFLSTLLKDCFSITCAVLVLLFTYSRNFYKRNAILVWSVFFSLLLASVSFTSARQLTCPSLLSGILTIRALMRFFPSRLKLNKKSVVLVSSAFSLMYLSLCVAVFIIRQDTSQALKNLHQQASEHKSTLIYTFAETHPLLRKILNPFDFNLLPVVFDGYTKKGLSRLYNGSSESGKVTTILPVSIETLTERSAGSRVVGKTIKTAPLIKGYRCAAIPNGIKVSGLRDASGKKIPFERVRIADGTLLVVPDSSGSGTLSFK